MLPHRWRTGSVEMPEARLSSIGRIGAICALPLILSISHPFPAQAISCPQGPYIVFFDEGVAFVDAAGRKILDNAIAAAGNCGYPKTTIVGHIDTSESDGLDAKRARTVKAYFTARGFPEEDIETLHAGQSIQRIPTGPDVPEQQNRRVEVTYGPLLSVGLDKIE